MIKLNSSNSIGMNSAKFDHGRTVSILPPPKVCCIRLKSDNIVPNTKFLMRFNTTKMTNIPMV